MGSGTTTRQELLVRLETLERELQRLRHELAPQGAGEPLPADEFQILACRVATGLVAFQIAQVDVVVPMAQLIHLPEAPPWLLGTLNLRGALVPTLDLHARLTGGQRKPGLADRIVVAAVGGRRVGFIVEELRGIETALPASVRSPPRDLACAPYVRGIVSVGDEAALLLSLESLVSSSDAPLPAGDGDAS